jgi:ABC-type Na+ efflux pump permease subunit
VADGAREASLRFWFPNLAFVLIVTAPIVTSRLVAEEWRSRHLDILLARPITPVALVVGKWLAAVAFFVLLLAPTLVYCAFLAAWGAPDWPPLVASYVGALATMAGFELDLRPPESARDMLAAVVGTLLAARSDGHDLAIMLDSELEVEGEACALSFMLLPTPEGVDELLQRIGLGG